MMLRTSLLYGFLSGLIMLTISFVAFLLDNDPPDYAMQEVVGFASIILSTVFVYLGIKRLRDKELNGIISFGKAVGTGLLISLIAAIMFALFSYAYYEWIDPDFSQKYLAWTIEQVRESGLSEAEIEQRITTLKQEYEAVWDNKILGSLAMIPTVLPFGLLVSIISAFMLRTKTSATNPG
ncbi:MAG: DUF4199 domain-containing protein [Bacteroidota bacterium]